MSALKEDRGALLAEYRATRAALLAAIDGLSDADLTEPSIDGWSVKDHLAHLALWDDLRAGEVERISAGHGPVWRLSEPQNDALNEISYAVRADLSLEQVRWEFARSRERLLAAIAAASDRGLDPSLYGDAGLRSGHEAEHTAWIIRWRTSRAS